MTLQEAFIQAIRSYYAGETYESVGKYTVEYFDEIEKEFLTEDDKPKKKKSKKKNKKEEQEMEAVNGFIS